MYSSGYSAVFREVIGGIVAEELGEAYADAEGISVSDKGKHIEELLSPCEAERIRFFLESYKGAVFSLYYIRHYSEKGIWKIKVRVRYPVVSLRGKRIDMPDEESGLFCDDGKTGRDETAVIMIDGDKTIPVYKSAGAELAAKKAGETIQTLAEKLSCQIRQCSEESVCRRLCVADQKEGTYSKIQLIPFTAEERRYIMLKFSGVEYSRFCSTQDLSDTYLIGICIIDTSTYGDEFFYDLNPYMCRLLVSGSITKDDIVMSYPFVSARRQGVSRFGFIRLKKEDFLIGVLPVNDSGGENRMMVFVVRSDGTQMVDDSCFDLLTPREGNVVRLVLEGMNSRSIGEALGISEGTVKRELFTSCKKLKVKGKIGMMMKMYHLKE